MCHITSCLECGKTTWGGCGRHQHKIKARTAPGMWCLCDKHTSKFWRLVIPMGESSAYWTQDARTRRRRQRARSNDHLPTRPPTSPIVRTGSPSARSQPLSIRGAGSAPELHDDAVGKRLQFSASPRVPSKLVVRCGIEEEEAAPGAGSPPAAPLTPSSCGVRFIASYFGAGATRVGEGSL